jgi:hypothetical protein
LVILDSCPIDVAQLGSGYGLIGESPARGAEIVGRLFRCMRDNRLSVPAGGLWTAVSVPIGRTSQVAACVEIRVNCALAMAA